MLATIISSKIHAGKNLLRSNAFWACVIPLLLPNYRPKSDCMHLFVHTFEYIDLIFELVSSTIFAIDIDLHQTTRDISIKWTMGPSTGVLHLQLVLLKDHVVRDYLLFFLSFILFVCSLCVLCVFYVDIVALKQKDLQKKRCWSKLFLYNCVNWIFGCYLCTHQVRCFLDIVMVFSFQHTVDDRKEFQGKKVVRRP